MRMTKFRSNSDQKQVTHTMGTGFLGLLTLLFIALKLTGFIFWSWWWVLSPIWIPTLAVFTFIGFLLLIVWVAEIRS